MCSLSDSFLLIFDRDRHSNANRSVDELCSLAQDQIIHDICDNRVCQNYSKSRRSSKNAIYLCDFIEKCVPICRKTLVDRGKLSNGPILAAGIVRSCN